MGGSARVGRFLSTVLSPPARPPTNMSTYLADRSLKKRNVRSQGQRGLSASQQNCEAPAPNPIERLASGLGEGGAFGLRSRVNGARLARELAQAQARSLSLFGAGLWTLFGVERARLGP